MYDKIIVLSKHFPFNNGETPAESFLENEIKCLSIKTKKIIVFACDADVNSKITCELPSNVEAIALRKQNIKKLKLKALLEGLKFLFNKDKSVSGELKLLDSIKKKLFLLYFCGKSEIKYSSIMKKIGTFKNEKVLFYSFWFFDAARTIVKLKNEFAKDNNVKIFSRAHRYDLYAEENSLNYLPQRRYLLENIDFVFPCSENGRNYLLKEFKEFKDKIVVSFLGTVDYGKQKEKNSIPTFVSCSRLVEVKRVERILDSLKILDETGVRLKWIHFGGGKSLEELREKSRSLKNIEVEFYGNVKNSELLKIYSENYYKFFVNVSESEGLPISIMEATSFGIPVIATDVGGTSEIIEEEKNGYLLDKNFKNEELSTKILEVLKLSDEEYSRKRNAAREIWKKKFEYKSNFEKMFSILQN